MSSLYNNKSLAIEGSSVVRPVEIAMLLRFQYINKDSYDTEGTKDHAKVGCERTDAVVEEEEGEAALVAVPSMSTRSFSIGISPTMRRKKSSSTTA